MSALTINQLNDFDFEVTNHKDINCQVWFIDNWTNKVNGKGSRKHKETVLQAVQDFISNKKKEEEERQEKKLKEKRQALKETQAYKEIDLLQLYEVVQMGQDYHTNVYRQQKSLLTGLEIKDDYNNVIAFNKHTIKNTSIYCLGSDSFYERKALTDNRIFIIGMAKHAYVTGLALKEMLYNGIKSYNNIRLIKDRIELYTILDYGKTERRAQILGDFTSDNDKLDMKQRIQKELERAKNGNINLPEARVTNDNKPIQKAFFASKPCSFKEIEEMYLATYDDYVIMNNIVLDKDTFNRFKNSLDMNILPMEFKGGTDSNYKDVPKDYIELLNDPIKHQKFIDQSYRLVLKVSCNNYSYSLLVDPQGYDYARYAALINN